MIRLGNGLYVCHLNGHILKVVYKGNNECEIYLGDEFQGRAPFDYVKKKLSLMEKRWSTSKIQKYQYKELHPTVNQLI
ncbi:hypothetical protein [Fictibacillus phosphorivorans]|uniref:hypothetical protein n=1 Tax=Fictibacillus phosphorivorans TaxID=1221500 RepID=UPI0035ECB7E6